MQTTNDPAVQDLRQTLMFSINATMQDLAKVRVALTRARSPQELAAAVTRLHELGDWLCCDCEYLGRYRLVESGAGGEPVDRSDRGAALAALQARSPSLTTAAQLQATGGRP